MCKFYSCVSNGKGRVEGFEAYEIRDMIKNKVEGVFNSHTFLCEIKKIKEDKWNKWEYDPFNKVLVNDILVTDNDELWVKEEMKRKFKGMNKDRILEMQDLFSRIIGKYKNGKEEGYWEEYYSNGKLNYKGNYKNGKQEGYWEGYHDNGKLWYKGNYKDGVIID